jgi:hypothetical protein
MSKAEREAIRAQRTPAYGHSPALTPALIGRAWAAMVQGHLHRHGVSVQVPDLPPDLVDAMFCATKLIRMTVRDDADDINDGIIYLEMAEEWRNRNERT